MENLEYTGSLPSDQFEDEWEDQFSTDSDGKVHLRNIQKGKYGEHIIVQGQHIEQDITITA